MTDSFEYYMIRVHRTAGRPVGLAGQVERLGTGEKRGFETGDQLARLVETWPAAYSELGRGMNPYPDSRRPS